MKPSPAQKRKMDAFIDSLMKRMTLEEELGQMNLVASKLPTRDDIAEQIRKGSMGGLLGDLFDNRFATSGPAALRQIQEIAVNESRLGIPLLFAYDVIHGHQTVFPIPLAVSCSWNLRHIETMACIGALEATANGINWVFSPMVDLGVDPRWGRVAEGSGCDPHLGASIAEAMVKGYQGTRFFFGTDNVAACVKHFIGYSAAEGGRDYNSADMSTYKLLSSFYPPFLAAAKTGVASMMPSFSAVNGLPSHADKNLIGRYRNDEFDGLIVSDYNAIAEMASHGIGDRKGQRDEDPFVTLAVRALEAGVDMDMASGAYLKLGKALAQGKITIEQIDAACRRILEIKYRLGLFENPYRYFDEEKAKRIHGMAPKFREAAREVAADSCVLLKNDNNLLPLPKSGITVALVGPLADDRRNVLGPWSFGGNSDDAVSVLQGFKNVVGDNVKVLYAKGANLSSSRRTVDAANFCATKVINDARSPKRMIKEALAAAKESDVIVAVVGEAAEMTGEAASSVKIEIPKSQRKLLKALVKTGKPIVAVLMNGRPLVLKWENKHISAILETWFGGTEAGNAIADLLFGDRNPSGSLTMPFPRHAGQRPVYHNDLPTGRPNWEDGTVQYSTNCFVDCAVTPLYPFGHGLSYSTFSYSQITANKTELSDDNVLEVSVTVENTGRRRGEHTVQVYVRDPVASLSRPMNELIDFTKIGLEPGERKIVTFAITPEDLKFYNDDLGYDWEPGEFVVGIGRHPQDLQTISVNWTKDPVTPKQKPRRRERVKTHTFS